MYFRNFYWLDKKWLETNFNLIFNSPDEKLWTSAMSGYLLNSELYITIYNMFSTKGLYIKALNTNFKTRISIIGLLIILL